MTYDDMKTGMTYGEVFSGLWVESPDPTAWRYKRRHTVLGTWRMIKQYQWREHLRTCAEIQKEVDEDRLDEGEAQAEREAIMAECLLPDVASSPYDDDFFARGIVPDVSDEVPF